MARPRGLLSSRVCSALEEEAMVALVKALGERALSTGDPGMPWEGSPGVDRC